ncbi:hypothetical protein [Allobaculum sp. JKK-2023]|uniref:hypothetical protein n=1 Tax=Allobaculum sp. JKK-2023 TaxID=3108943 RepID=UPI002B05FD3D|nr:hypothetical protein [Allobaculum sp. JKK-2023]
MKKVLSTLLSSSVIISLLSGACSVPVLAQDTYQPISTISASGEKKVVYDEEKKTYYFQNVTLDEYLEACSKNNNGTEIVTKMPDSLERANTFVQNIVARTSVPGPDFSQISLACAVNMNCQYVNYNGTLYVQFVSIIGNTMSTNVENGYYTFTSTPSLTARINNGGATFSAVGSVQLENTVNINLGGSIHTSWFTISGSVSGACRCRSRLMSVNFQYNLPLINVVM